MGKIRLTTTQNIVKNTPMGGNVDVSKYIFLIDLIQKSDLEPVLGTKLYNKIKTDYNTNALTGLYLQIHTDYIEDFLNYEVYATYVNAGGERIVNNGNIKHTPDNSQVLTNAENVTNASKYFNTAGAYLSDLERFLSIEGVNIPEYNSQDNEYDDKAKNNEGIGSVTWYFGK